MQITAIVLALVAFLGAAGAHFWSDHKKAEELRTAIEKKGEAQAKYETCLSTNDVNQATIERQRKSIDEFVSAQNETLERNRVLAEELAARQIAEGEISRRNRAEARQILSGEACAAVEYPPAVRRLFNDAIVKASAGGDEDG